MKLWQLRKTHVASFAGLCGGVLLVAALAGCGQSEKEIVVVYPSASGLEVGDELRFSEYAIGRVRKIELEPSGDVSVRIQIDSEYADHVTEESSFTIKRDGFLSPDRFIEMVPPSEGGGAVAADGTRFVGEPSWEDQLKRMTEKLLDSAGDEDFRERLEQLADAAERATEAGRQEWEARRPELEAEAQALLEQIERESSDAAEKLRREIEKYLEELLEATPPPTDEEVQI